QQAGSSLAPTHPNPSLVRCDFQVVWPNAAIGDEVASRDHTGNGIKSVTCVDCVLIDSELGKAQEFIENCAPLGYRFRLLVTACAEPDLPHCCCGVHLDGGDLR